MDQTIDSLLRSDWVANVKKYWTLWSSKTMSDVKTLTDHCTVCSLMDVKCDKHFHNKVANFAKYMPETLVGTILTWIYLHQNPLTLQDVMNLNPIHIFWHYILEACSDPSNDVNIKNAQIYQFLAAQNNHRDNDIDTDHQHHLHSPQTPTPEEIQEAIQKCKKYAKRSISHPSLTNCFNCVYADNGECTEIINDMALLVDARVYPYDNNPNLFKHSHYGTLQPGVYHHGTTRLDTIIATTNTTETDDFKSPNVAKLEYLIKSQETKVRGNYELRQQLIEQLDRLNELMDILQQDDDQQTILANITHNCPLCDYCSIPAIFAIIQDMLVMEKSKRIAIGIAPADLAVDKDRYRWLFDNWGWTGGQLTLIKKEWLKKYSFLVQHNDIAPFTDEIILKHFNTLKCQLNVKRCCSKTDSKLNSSDNCKLSCVLPLFIHGKGSGIRNKQRKLCDLHGIKDLDLGLYD